MRKEWVRFAIVAVIELALYEFCYTRLPWYEGSENAIYALMLSMGCSGISWNGLVFPILCATPFSLQYASEYKSGYLWLLLKRTSEKKFFCTRLLKNATLGGAVLAVPYLLYACQLFLLIGMDQPMSNIDGQAIVHYMPDLAIAHPGIYVLLLGVFVFLCGAATATFTLGIVAVVKNQFLGLGIPFALFVLIAIVTPDSAWSPFNMFCPNEYLYVQTYHVLIMDAVFFLLGVGLFLYGMKKNEKIKQIES